jgi:hypothetical protein
VVEEPETAEAEVVEEEEEALKGAAAVSPARGAVVVAELKIMAVIVLPTTGARARSKSVTLVMWGTFATTSS